MILYIETQRLPQATCMAQDWGSTNVLLHFFRESDLSFLNWNHRHFMLTHQLRQDCLVLILLPENLATRWTIINTHPSSPAVNRCRHSFLPSGSKIGQPRPFFTKGTNSWGGKISSKFKPKDDDPPHPNQMLMQLVWRRIAVQQFTISTSSPLGNHILVPHPLHKPPGSNTIGRSILPSQIHATQSRD